MQIHSIIHTFYSCGLVEGIVVYVFFSALLLTFFVGMSVLCLRHRNENCSTSCIHIKEMMGEMEKIMCTGSLSGPGLPCLAAAEYR